MSFCAHCAGQRFDRAQVLRALREEQRKLRRNSRAEDAIRVAIQAVRRLEIPHLEEFDDPLDEQVVH